MVSVNAQPRLHRGRLLTVIAVMTLLAGVFGIWPSGALGAPTCDVSTLITAFNNANANPTGTTFASLQAGCTYTLSGVRFIRIAIARRVDSRSSPVAWFWLAMVRRLSDRVGMPSPTFASSQLPRTGVSLC